jgi:multidrug efflux pump
VQELGNATGFDFYMQDQAGLGHDALMNARNKFLALAAKSPALQRVRPNGLNDEPQYVLEIDDERARAGPVSGGHQQHGVDCLGFQLRERLHRPGPRQAVYLQGRPNSRMSPEDLNKWFVRNDKGDMVPFSSFATGKWGLDRRSCSATTVCRRWKSSASRQQARARVKPWRR